jgi:hypothetical protein
MPHTSFDSNIRVSTIGENVLDVQALAVLCRIPGETIAIALAGPIDRMQSHETAYVSALRRPQRKIEDAQFGAAFIAVR